MSNAFLSKVAAHPTVLAAISHKRRQHCPVGDCKFAAGGATVRHSSALLDHYALHHVADEEKQILCDFIVAGEQCSERCGSGAELRDHKRAKHNTGTFECVACPG
jgi:hypothetical protein